MCDYNDDDCSSSSQPGENIASGSVYDTAKITQAATPNPYGTSLFHRLRAVYQQEQQRLNSEHEAFNVRGKVLDILSRHPEFEELIFVIQNLEA